MEKASQLKLPRLPSEEEFMSWPGWQQEWMFHPERGSGAMPANHFILWLATYFTLIEYIDSEIGRLLATLESRGVLDSTHIVFTSDHGDQAGERGMIGKVLKNESLSITRVPFIWRPASRLTGATRGHRVHEVVELVDLYPTLCDLCGIRGPEELEELEELEGRSLVPQILRGKAGDPERTGVCETYWTRTIEHNGLMLVFARLGDANCQLYDLNNDPQAYLNVYDDSVYANRRFQIKRKLLQFLFKRIYGGWSSVDVEAMSAGLDPDAVELPPATNNSLLFDHKAPLGNKGLFNFFRCGVFLMNNHYAAYVAFNDDEMLLFNGDRGYQTRADAIQTKLSIIEPMIDATIRLLMTQSYPTAMHDVEMPIKEKMTKEQVQDWLKKARATHAAGTDYRQYQRIQLKI